MKRSEMIQNMATEIIMKDCNITYDIAQDMAEAILQMQEKEGMLPPDIAFVHPDLEYTDNVWEKEDE